MLRTIGRLIAELTLLVLIGVTTAAWIRPQAQQPGAKPLPKVTAEAKVAILEQMLRQQRLQTDINYCNGLPAQVPGQLADIGAKLDEAKSKALKEAGLSPDEYDLNTQSWEFITVARVTRPDKKP